MSNYIWILILVGLGCAGNLSAQVDTSRSKYGTYFFDEDEVVFEFDLAAFEKAIHSPDSLMVDFADLKIKNVAITGNFNEWSGDGWKMKKMKNNRYQLRKPVAEFKDAPNWQFRFVINGKYWTPPDSVLIKEGILGWYNLQNPGKTGPLPCDTGNVLFHLQGYPQAGKVVLTGSFNNWNEESILMKKTAGGWEVRIHLPAGIHEYKFIADGKWTHDPDNSETRPNQYLTLNSVLRVGMPYVFHLDGFQTARKVALAGSFNHWNPDDIHLQKTPTGWEIPLDLTSGKHLYKFIVDGQWMTDPQNRRTERDLEGNEISLLLIP